MQDDALIEAFEACTLPPSALDHTNHVRLAWILLRREAAPRVLDRLGAALKRYAAFYGVADRYHETVTWAFVLLVHERMRRGPADETFDDFRARSPDLFEKGTLRRYYQEATLSSAFARSVFVFPDKVV